MKSTSYPNATYLNIVFDIEEDRYVEFEVDMKNRSGRMRCEKLSLDCRVIFSVQNGILFINSEGLPTSIDLDMASALSMVRRFIWIENPSSDPISSSLNAVLNDVIDDKSITKNSMVNTFSEYIKNDRAAVNYADEAKKYISNLTFINGDFDMSFKEVDLSRVKYIVAYYQCPSDHYFRMSFIVVYNNVKKTGRLLVFTGSGEFKYTVADVTSNQSGDGIAASFYIGVDGGNFPTHDDLVIDTGAYREFKYVRFVETDEAMMGSLMDLFSIYKLSNYPTTSECDARYVMKEGALDSQSLMSAFTNFIQSDITTRDYYGLAEKHVACLTFDPTSIEISLQDVPPKAKYVIVKLDDDGYNAPKSINIVVVFDLINYKGSAIMWLGGVANTPHAITDATGELYHDSQVNKDCISIDMSFLSSLDYRDYDLMYGHYDPLVDTGAYGIFKYIEFIEADNDDSLDELIGGLMKLFNDYTLSRHNLKPSTTITHYCPIEAGEEITDFKVGKPVFLSGHVYKRVNGKWVSSTATDSTDCICSVIVDGSYKEFVGVITSVDESNGCITFATHGDMLFTVDDANLYQIGDVILFNGKILDEDYAMTLRIQQSIVGKVTGKINETTLAVFRS
ncbi:hypothetical protein M9Y10_024231 [Tritrichomonas musculus]|uniref:Uncharacterized protein n=1 Tax=Tritrichomonas musculus TaxID=1915356 RepID=A0ABR2HD76_9EUKA